MLHQSSELSGKDYAVGYIMKLGLKMFALLLAVIYNRYGISFSGDYLPAASFLCICGLIATTGYDGFLYSIGYLAGWIVALFIVAGVPVYSSA